MEDFVFQYSSAFGMARGSQEILDFVNSKIEEAEALQKKERGESVDKLREALS